MNRKISRLLLLVIVFNLSFAGMCSKSTTPSAKTIERRVVEAEDDVSTGLESLARVLTQAKQIDAISQQDIDAIKPIMQSILNYNDKAIEVAKKMVEGKLDPASQLELTEIITKASAALTELNNMGLTRIKDPAKRAAFNSLILLIQNAATTITTLLVQQTGD